MQQQWLVFFLENGLPDRDLKEDYPRILCQVWSNLYKSFQRGCRKQIFLFLVMTAILEGGHTFPTQLLNRANKKAFQQCLVKITPLVSEKCRKSKFQFQQIYLKVEGPVRHNFIRRPTKDLFDKASLKLAQWFLRYTRSMKFYAQKTDDR